MIYHLVVPLFIVILWVLLIFSLNNIPQSSLEYEEWTLFADFGSLCCFYVNLFKHVWIIMNIWRHDAKEKVLTVHMVVAAINMIAGSTNLLRFLGWNGMCEDPVGFAVPLTLWVEWLVCVPTMGFLATFTDEDDVQPHLDILFIASLGTCILLGFCSTFVKMIWAYVLLLVGSYAVFIASVGIVISQGISHRGYQILDGTHLNLGDVEAATELRSVLNRSLKSKKLRRLLLFVLPPFPILYMLGTFHVLSLEWTYVGMCLANFGAKYVFLTDASELHVDFAEKLVVQLNSERVLQQAQLHVEKTLNESRRVYLRYVFHEVRVPLNSLSLGLNVLKDKKDLADDERDALLMMQDSATFMADTLNDVLSINQIEEGKMSLKFQKMSVREMLQRALSTLKGAAVGKGIELLPLVGADVPNVVMADKFRLEHVVANLVSNAIKFSPSGSKIKIRIDIDAKDVVEKEISKEGKFLPNLTDFTISVEDQGCGLSGDDIRNLFTPFQQLRPDAEQQRNGTGLGLSLARSIVRLHGGELTCKSELGHGCTFIIRLPLEVCTLDGLTVDHDCIDERTDGCTTAHVQSGTAHFADTSKPSTHDVRGVSVTDVMDSAERDLMEMSVLSEAIGNIPSVIPTTEYTGESSVTDDIKALLVDDTPSNRKMLAMVLSKKNITSAFADNGLKGVEAVRAKPDHFEIIFMDNTMPVMNGVEATRAIRSEGFANLVVGVTGNALDDDVEAFLAAGADLVIAKPMQSAHLEALMVHIAVHGCGSSGRKLKIVDDTIQFVEPLL